MIYLDHSATTPIDSRVEAVMERLRREVSGNPGSVHRVGQRARVQLESDREVLGRILGAEPREIIFTGGGTEANNLALKGYALRARSDSGEWPTIVTARTEHHAILHPVEWLASLGCDVRYVDLDPVGRVDPERFARLVERLSPPFLVTLMHGNNETGVVHPVAQLARITHQQGGVFHTDAVQSFGKLPIEEVAGVVDMLSISAHKIGGPRGVGMLYVRRDVELEPLHHGGAQERDRRAGTEPVDLIAGMAEAARLAVEGMEERMGEVARLREDLRRRLSTIRGIRFVTPEEEVLPTILNVTFEDAGELDGEGLIVGMDIRGVAVSNGSACTSGSMQPSHVLKGIGYPDAMASSAVRFSLGTTTTDDDIRLAANALADVLHTMRIRN